MSCLTSVIFVVLGRLINGSVGLVVSGGEAFGFGRFRLARFVGKGGEVVVTIISGSGSGGGGTTMFSLRFDRFVVFFFE